MEGPGKDEVLLLADEKFDFDLSLSSVSANEDDEVFFGPVGHKERCIAASLELGSQRPAEPPSPAPGSPLRWSPVPGEQFVEVYKEARLLALRIESSRRSHAAPAAGPHDAVSQEDVERFIQESQLKMNLFEKENKTRKSPNSLKRETYYLSDSPLGAPQPPSGQGLPSAPAQAGLARTPRPPLPARSLPVEPGPVHPPNLAGTQKKVVSKLLPPRAPSARGKSTREAVEPMKEKPASPSRMKILNEKESHRDVPHYKPRAAQDVTSLPALGSHLVQGKQSLPIPNKPGLKKSLLKPPGAGALARKPRALGPVCAAPAAGREKSSERPSISADSSRPPSNPSQAGQAGTTAVQPALQADPAAVCRPAQSPGLAVSTAEQPAAPTSPAVVQPQTPARGGPRLHAQPSSSLSSRLSRAGGSRRDSFPNPKTRVMPAPASQFKTPKFPTGDPPDSATPRFSRAQRPQSCASAGRAIHSTPARRSSGPASRTPLSTRRVSALPTPAGRRLSGLPLLTPTTVPRTLPSPLCVSAQRLSSEPRGVRAVRAGPGSSRQAAPQRSGASSDGRFSPPEAVPRALCFSPEESDVTVSESVTAELARGEAQPLEELAPGEAVLVDIRLDQLHLAPKAASSPRADAPLIDFCSTPEADVALRADSRPLIDLLVNTPDTDRNTGSKPLPEVGQLIDLCSPLIQLSPEANKENVDSPLLKF
ncbi:G2 and S phase-expressed protein 1 isoform 1-T1 [Molossus nigricans]